MNNVIVAQVLQKICNASGADTHPIKGGLQLTPFLTYNWLVHIITIYNWSLSRRVICKLYVSSFYYYL